MTRAELEAQRAEVMQAEQDHLLKAAEARGAVRLIDLWLARLGEDAPALDREVPATPAGKDTP